MLEGLAGVFSLRVVLPASLGPRVANWESEAFQREILAGGRLLFPIRVASWLIRERDSYDAVIAQDNLTAALGANIARLLTRKPVVLRMGRTTVEYFRAKRRAGARGPKYWLGLLVVKMLVAFNERAAGVVGASSEYIGRASSGRARLIRVVPAYGVDTKAFRPEPPRPQARKSIGVPIDGSFVIWRSRLAPEKDPETFLRAIGILRSKGREVTGLYVGGEYSRVSELARSFGTPLIARDHVHPRELHLYYRAADVAVQTSWAEGFGISPLEALASGTPVVASRTGGLVETIVDGSTGITVPVGDAAATAEAIELLLDDPAEAERLAMAGRKMVEEKFSERIAFEGWRRLIEDVIAKRGSR